MSVAATYKSISRVFGSAADEMDGGENQSVSRTEVYKWGNVYNLIIIPHVETRLISHI